MVAKKFFGEKNRKIAHRKTLNFSENLHDLTNFNYRRATLFLHFLEGFYGDFFAVFLWIFFEFFMEYFSVFHGIFLRFTRTIFLFGRKKKRNPMSCAFIWFGCVGNALIYFTRITRYLLVDQKMSGFVMRRMYCLFASCVSV